MILSNIILSVFNVLNAYIDAYKILKAQKSNLRKAIAHGVNFGIYATLTGLCIWYFKMHAWLAVVYAFSAFFNRQITFDIPLNWRRGLSAFYVSLDNPPKALMDRIEVRIFGYNGKASVFVYSVLWVVTSIIQIFVK